MSGSKGVRTTDDRRSIDIDKPYWDQNTYRGRALHFLALTNPLNSFVSDTRLDYAKDVIDKFRNGHSLESLNISEKTLWKLKYTYDSAHHPDTGERMLRIGRMSSQVPMNMIITGCMMAYYKTPMQVMTWQWVNQSFNAIVNYTNRSGSTPVPTNTIMTSYVTATFGAGATALSLNILAKHATPLLGRLVPFAAVAAANGVNIPMMRISELQNGIELQTEQGEKVGYSQRAAKDAIVAVTLSRILMASPSMILAPVVMNFLIRRNLIRDSKIKALAINMLICGTCLTFATPLCCALFRQRVPVSVEKLEPDVRQKILERYPRLQYVYYNKGL